MVILGIDPGYAIVGYGVVISDGRCHAAVDYGVIETPKTDRFPVRLAHIAKQLSDLIDRCRPDAIAIEELFFHTNKTTVIMVAEARGVILYVAESKGIPLYEYTPLQIKQSLTGYGRAVKTQMQEMVKGLLRLDKIPRPDDAADALAVALTHAQTNQRMGRYGI